MDNITKKDDEAGWVTSHSPYKEPKPSLLEVNYGTVYFRKDFKKVTLPVLNGDFECWQYKEHTMNTDEYFSSLAPKTDTEFLTVMLTDMFMTNLELSTKVESLEREVMELKKPTEPTEPTEPATK